MGIASVFDKSYLWIAGKSWRFRQNTSKVICINLPYQKLRVPIINGIGFDNVYYYRENLYSVIGLLTNYKKGVFVDIGANIGQMLVNILIERNFTQYIGFEPNILCCSYLEKLIQLNSLSNCSVIPVGLSDRFQVLDLMHNGPFDVCASTTPSFRPDNFFSSSKKVILETGDNMLAQFSLPDIAIMKIDVEGGELEVLTGLQATIRKHKPMLLLEVLPYLHIAEDTTVFSNITEKERLHIIETRKRRTKALESMLMELDYVWYRIEENGNLLRLLVLGADGPKQRLEMNFLAIHNSEEMAFGNYATKKIL